MFLSSYFGTGYYFHFLTELEELSFYLGRRFNEKSAAMETLRGKNCNCFDGTFHVCFNVVHPVAGSGFSEPVLWKVPIFLFGGCFFFSLCRWVWFIENTHFCLGRWKTRVQVSLALGKWNLLSGLYCRIYMALCTCSCVLRICSMEGAGVQQSSLSLYTSMWFHDVLHVFFLCPREIRQWQSVCKEWEDSQLLGSGWGSYITAVWLFISCESCVLMWDWLDVCSFPPSEV